MKWSRDFSSSRWRVWLTVTMTLGALLLIWWQVGRWYQAELIEDQQAAVNNSLASYSRALTSAINNRVNRLAGLKAFVETDPSAGNLDANFRTFAMGLYAGTSGIRNFVVAPNGINQYVYPLARNEVVPRHNQFTDQRPVAQADAIRARESGALVITGPYALRQGGFGLVARQAVYEADGQFWGMVSMVIDMPPVYAEAGLEEAADDLDLALRTADGTVFFGPEAVFDNEPVIQPVVLLDGQWELAGVPAAGWEATIARELFFFRIIGLFVVLVVILLAYTTASRHHELDAAVKTRTAALARANAQLQQEIEERTQVQEQLRMQATLLDSVRESVVATDLEGNIIYWGRGAEKLYGYSRAEALGKPITFIVEPGNEKKEKWRISQVRRTGSWRGQYVQRRKDGSKFWAEAVISLVRDEQGQPWALIGIDRDISERKQAEAALRESERRFRDVLENVKLVAIMLDVKGNLTFCNNFFLELTGWQQADVLGANWFETFIPAEIQEELVHSVFEKTVRTGQFPVYYENEIVTRSGERRLISWNNTVHRDSQGQITEITSLGIDITEQKQAETRLKDSLREKIVLLREIHHRVKNNLQIISSILALQASSIDDEQTRQALRDSQSRVRSMSMVHETLYQSPNLTGVDMASYVTNTVRQLFSVYPGRSGHIDLELQIEPILLDLDTAIPCGLIINELVSNALKHAFPLDSTNGGSPRNKILVKLSAGDDQQVELIVADNGLGLTPDFDWQQTTSLGLQLVAVLVGQIDGQISHDRNGPGTSVTVTFPHEE